jgi:hypothetical protein
MDVDAYRRWGGGTFILKPVQITITTPEEEYTCLQYGWLYCFLTQKLKGSAGM